MSNRGLTPADLRYVHHIARRSGRSVDEVMAEFMTKRGNRGVPSASALEAGMVTQQQASQANTTSASGVRVHPTNPSNHSPHFGAPQTIRKPKANHYFRVGSTLRAEFPATGRKMIFCVDDITKHVRENRETETSLFFVNPPFSEGSRQRWESSAARVTHGVEPRTCEEIYRGVAAQINWERDAFIWMVPNNDDALSFVLGLVQGESEVLLNGVPGYAHFVLSKSIMDFVLAKRRDAFDQMTKNDSDVNFDLMFGSKSLPFGCIVDPCAGKHPLADQAGKRQMSYYGVEISGLAGMNIFQIRNIVRKYGGRVVDVPVAEDGPPSSSPFPEQRTAESVPDLSQGRRVGVIREFIKPDDPYKP